VGAEFLARHYPGPKLIFLPDPTWANHNKIFPAGGIEIRKYRYYLPKTRGLDYEVWLEAFAVSVMCVSSKLANLTRRCRIPDKNQLCMLQGLIADLSQAPKHSIVVRVSSHVHMHRCKASP
jgi:Aminotransferase class I and II